MTARAEAPAHWHRLSEIDPVARTAICSVCGPTRIRPRTGRGSECLAKKREYASRRVRDIRWEKYGMTPAMFAQMSADQEGCCAICRRVDRDLVVDHDHESGAVRGLLCGLCNSGIGMLGDDPGLIIKAATYLAS